MKVSPLWLASCRDRSEIQQARDPGRWLAEDTLPAGWVVHGFHFFVNWQTDPLDVGDTFLLTRLVVFDEGEDPLSVTESDILTAFRDAGLPDKFGSLRRVCVKYGKELVSVLLPECETAVLNDATPFWTVKGNQNGELIIARSTVLGLKNAIRKHSGGPVLIGKKGLIYSTSAIECILSLTDAAYPGDADAVVIDGDDHVRHIIEFKKHTLSAPLGEHLADRYYPKPDGRKYKRLHALASAFESSGYGAVSLIILYYSTRASEIRLQMIDEVSQESLKVGKDSGDVCIEGKSDQEVADTVMTWLGIRE